MLIILALAIAGKVAGSLLHQDYSLGDPVQAVYSRAIDPSACQTLATQSLNVSPQRAVVYL